MTATTLPETTTDGRIATAFWQFHHANPHVYTRLTHLARNLHQQGRQRVGMKMLFEVLRWHHLSTTGDADGFRLNNNYHAYYARLIMAREPDLDGVFELRRLHGAELEPFGQEPNPDAPVGHVAPPSVITLPDADRLF